MKEQISKKLAEMEQKYDQQAIVVEQAKANLNAMGGAIQILRDLLGQCPQEN